MSEVTHRILVLDDDPDISLMLRLMLEYRGYVVNTAGKPQDAYSFLEKNKVDLIVMDMLLSGVNGIDVCLHLKQTETTQSIPVLMISAHPNAQKICLDAGADDFISKPFDMHDILARINQLIKE
jgi:DNA-binding response OmpR family regulator